ncbi:MAG: phosphoribosyltransferase family protein, partial [Flavobacteriaceae bacterium]
SIAPFEILLVALDLDKSQPQGSIRASVDPARWANQSVVVVDDVLNTGKTLMYAVNFILQTPLKQIKTAVLVNRNHKKYPIKGDFKGISLSTSLKEHIDVSFEGENIGAYLS